MYGVKITAMLDHLVSQLTAISAQHWLLAYLLVGLIAWAEAIPVVGVVVPGSVLIVGISALVPSGALNIWPLIVAAVVGAIAGDGLSFWFGRRFEHGLVTLWPLRRYPHLITQSEDLFRRHGGKSVFLARFIQGPRAFVPLVAGMSDMPPVRFYAFNVVSALIWAPSHVIGGVALGASLQLVTEVAGRLALFLALMALVIWVVVWLTRRVILGSGLRWLAALQHRLTLWSAEGDTWPRRLALGLLQPERSETRALVLGAVILAGSLWLFLGILEDILTGDPLVQANQAIFHFLQSLRTTWGDNLMLAMTELGDSFVIIILTGVILGWLLWCRAWQAACYWIAAIGGASLFTPLIKRAVHWPRPTDLYTGWDAFSFPSGHATINAVLYGFLGFLIARELPPRRRVWVIAGISVLISLIAFSRLYLGAHWLADVTAGIAVATAWITLLAVSYTRHRPRSLRVKYLVSITLLTLALTWPYHMYRQLADDEARYTPKPAPQTLSLTEWNREAYRLIPARRIDLGGESEEPMVLQWAGELTTLDRKLIRHGWQASTPWKLDNIVQWMSPTEAVSDVPVLPRLHNGQTSALQLTRDVDGSPSMRMVLRVWATNINITNEDAASTIPLWIGSVMQQRRYHLLGLVPMTRSLSPGHAAARLLAESLPDSVVAIQPGKRSDDWDGRVVLGWEPWK